MTPKPTSTAAYLLVILALGGACDRSTLGVASRRDATTNTQSGPSLARRPWTHP